MDLGTLGGAHRWCLPRGATSVSDVSPAPSEQQSTSTAPATTAQPVTPLDPNGDSAAIADALDGVLGPDSDPLASVSAFLELPGGLPLPPEPVVIGFQLQAGSQVDGVQGTTELELYMWTPATAADLATYFRTLLPGAGWTESGDRGPVGTEDASQLLEFTPPDGSWTGLSVGLVDLPGQVAVGDLDAPTTGSHVRFTLARPTQPEDIDRVDSWIGPTPSSLDGVSWVWVDAENFRPLDHAALRAVAHAIGSAEDVAAQLQEGLTNVRDPLVEPQGALEGAVVFVADAPDGATRTYIVSPEASGEEATVEIQMCARIERIAEEFLPAAEWLFWSTCGETIGVEARPQESVVTAPPTTTPPSLEPVTAGPATTDEITDAVAELLGPTEDVVAAVAPLAVIPDSIRTPAGAVIEVFDLIIDLESEFDRLDLELTSTGSVDDVATLYDATLTADYVRTSDERSADGSRTLLFGETGGIDDVPVVAVTVSPRGAGSFIELDLCCGIVEQGALGGHTWALPLTGITETDVVSWRITYRVLTDEPELDLFADYRPAGDPTSALRAIAEQPPPDVTAVEGPDETFPDTLFLERPGYSNFSVTSTVAGCDGCIGVRATVPLDLED